MKIGTKVFVKATAHSYYEEIEKGCLQRIWIKEKCDREGWYVGYTHKQEGDYVIPKATHTYFSSNFNYEQPYLRNIRSIKLLRIKFTERSNDSFAYPADVVCLQTL